MADLPDEERREGLSDAPISKDNSTPLVIAEQKIDLLDSESGMKLCEYVDGILIVRTQDECVHYIPEESISRWSKWRDPTTQTWKLRISTDSGDLPIIAFDSLEACDLSCQVLCSNLSIVEG
ncbi:MAG: hypothetical protein DRQ40_06975 [Gammaproteobacteria bacterium]|nr:MAG: hypothetical protein DRQ40_06975 [Gammaproteobacteria bacterium]